MVKDGKTVEVASGSTDLSEGAFPDETLDLVPVHPHLSRSDSVVVVLIVPLVLSPLLLV